MKNLGLLVSYGGLLFQFLRTLPKEHPADLKQKEVDFTK